MARLTAHPPVTIYTTPTCPDCHALKAWLRQHRVAFDERDLTDPAVAVEARERTGVRVAPITIIENTVIYGTFTHQKPLIEARLFTERTD